jgi:hypothetical protein
VNVRAEDPVEGAARKPVDRELELERRHVPAGEPAVERPRPQAVPREPAERPARLRPRDAVDGDPGVSLEPADRASRRAAANAVDGASIEPVCAQRDLQRRDAGAHRGRAGSCRRKSERDDEKRQRKSEPCPHGGRLFRHDERAPCRRVPGGAAGRPTLTGQPAGRFSRGLP